MEPKIENTSIHEEVIKTPNEEPAQVEEIKPSFWSSKTGKMWIAIIAGALLAVLVLVVVVYGATSSKNSKASPTPTPSTTTTPTVTMSETPTPSQSPTPTLEPTATPMPTQGPTATPIPTNTKLYNNEAVWSVRYPSDWSFTNGNFEGKPFFKSANSNASFQATDHIALITISENQGAEPYNITTYDQCEASQGGGNAGHTMTNRTLFFFNDNKYKACQFTTRDNNGNNVDYIITYTFIRNEATGKFYILMFYETRGGANNSMYYPVEQRIFNDKYDAMIQSFRFIP